jgi:predicted extracellular nuclease
MTWNVENLFDILDPHPSDPPMPSLQEYRRAITKVANTILAAGAPTIVGLQEVENIGILEDIAEHDLLAGFDYQPILIEGTDSRGIDVGYLVRGDVAEVLESEQFPAPAGLTSRPPLLIKVNAETSAGTATLYVLNNHFTSMSGGEQATEPRRIAQAAWNVEVLEQILADDPDAYAAVIGDLNSFYDSPPIDTLRAASLQHIFDLLPPEERYTYIYEGVSQTLDHILLTPELFSLIRRIEVLHVNADFPPPPPGDESPQHKSDHDPVVVTFSLTP